MYAVSIYLGERSTPSPGAAHSSPHAGCRRLTSRKRLGVAGCEGSAKRCCYISSSRYCCIVPYRCCMICPDRKTKEKVVRYAKSTQIVENRRRYVCAKSKLRYHTAHDKTMIRGGCCRVCPLSLVDSPWGREQRGIRLTGAATLARLLRRRCCTRFLQL